MTLRSPLSLFDVSTGVITSSIKRESSANKKHVEEILVGKSLIYIKNNKGPRTDP
jgi:hypothetical protein